jgi:hypothetical protein
MRASGETNSIIRNKNLIPLGLELLNRLQVSRVIMSIVKQKQLNHP